MSKKILALILAAAMSATLLASCGPKDNSEDTANDTANDTAVDTAVDTESDTTEEFFEDMFPAAPEVSEELSALHTAVKEAYGEDGYIPNMPIDPEMLTSLYGIEAEWVEEYVAEMPMIMTHVDTLIIVKPTEGNSENVLGALNAYHDYLVNDSMQYPMNIEKVRASQVFEKGGYVFFVMLGMLSDDAIYAEGTEEEIAAIQYNEAMANNQKAIDAINAFFAE